MNFCFFRRHLQGIAIAKIFLELISIPINLVSAKLLADIVVYATQGDSHAVLTRGAGLAALLVCYKIFDTVSKIKVERVSSKSVHTCKIELYEHILSNSVDKLYASDGGQLKERMTDDFNTAVNKIISVYPEMRAYLIAGIIYFVFIARLNWMLAVILTAIAFIQILPPVMSKKYFEKNYKDTRDIEAKLTDFVTEAYHGFAILKLYDLKNWYIEKLKKMHKVYSKIGNSGIYTGTAENMLDEIVSVGLKYGVYAVSGFCVLKNMVSLEVGVEIIALSGSFFAAVNTVFSSITSLAQAKEAEKRLLDFFAQQESERNLSSTCEHTSKGIVLSDIVVRYGDKTIFDRASVAFPMSGICLIKGSNGAGKTTLFKLITGLTGAKQGTVEVGGIAPKSFPENVFMREIFYLPQEDSDFAVYPMEFYEMAYGENPAYVMELAGAFGIEDEQLNKIKINELSGGERKKVFLALALVVNSRFLLLDEPTNSLDEDSKELLLCELKKRSGLTLIITHDSVFDDVCDYVFWVRDGGIWNE